MGLITQKLPKYYNKLTPDIADFDNEGDPLLKAIDFELNFLEFIAAGVHNDDFDEKLLQETIKTRLLIFYDQNEYYIQHWRKDGSSSTWRNFTKCICGGKPYKPSGVSAK